jgi:hypothetical protein
MTRSRHQVARRLPAIARTAPDGTVFDSAGELRRYLVLRMAEKMGLVRNLRHQVKFALVLPAGLPAPVPVKIRSAGYPRGRSCVYTADFAYDEATGPAWLPIVEEYKGMDDPVSRLRRAVAEAVHGIQIRLTGPAAVKEKRP